MYFVLKLTILKINLRIFYKVIKFKFHKKLLEFNKKQKLSFKKIKMQFLM